MTPEERKVIGDIFDRLKQAEGQPREPEAERFIADRIRAQPYAPYAMAQSIFVQEQALLNMQRQVDELQGEVQRLQSQPQGGGFLSSIFGGGQQPTRDDGQRRPTGPAGYGSRPGMQQPGGQGGPWGGGQQGMMPGQMGGQPGMMGGQPGMMGGGMMQGGAGGGFMRTAMTTAAGVAGGMMLGNVLSNAFSGGGGAHAAAGGAQGAAGDVSGLPDHNGPAADASNAGSDPFGAAAPDAGYSDAGYDSGGDSGGFDSGGGGGDDWT